MRRNIRNNRFQLPDVFELESLICQAKSAVIQYANDRELMLEYETSCIYNELERYGRLSAYLSVLEDLKKAILQKVKYCLDSYRVQSIVEAVNEMIPANCYKGSCDTLFVDEIPEDQWILDNPYCAAYEYYERLNYLVCEDISLKLDITQKDCDASLVFSVNEIKCDTTLGLSVDQVKTCETSLLLRVEPKLCEIVPYLNIYQKACDTDLKVNITKVDCEMQHKMLVTKYKCDLSLNQYITLIDCKLTPTFIASVYDCGLSFNVNTQTKDCKIQLKNHTVSLGTLTADQLTFRFDGESSCQALSKYNPNIDCNQVSITSAKILKEYK